MQLIAAFTAAALCLSSLVAAYTNPVIFEDLVCLRQIMIGSYPNDHVGGRRPSALQRHVLPQYFHLPFQSGRPYSSLLRPRELGVHRTLSTFACQLLR